MTLHPKVTGIDVAKHHLDVFSAATAARARLPNTPAALAEGQRPRVRPGTLVFVAYEIRLRLEQVQAEWVRLFRLTHARAAD